MLQYDGLVQDLNIKNPLGTGKLINVHRNNFNIFLCLLLSNFLILFKLILLILFINLIGGNLAMAYCELIKLIW